MNARALHEQQTQAARRRRTTSALRRGELVTARSEVWPKPMKALARTTAIGDTPIRTSSARGTYDGADLRGWLRPGADDHERYPSRMGNVRLWRDGRREVAA